MANNVFINVTINNNTQYDLVYVGKVQPWGSRQIWGKFSSDSTLGGPFNISAWGLAKQAFRACGKDGASSGCQFMVQYNAAGTSPAQYFQVGFDITWGSAKNSWNVTWSSGLQGTATGWTSSGSPAVVLNITPA